VHHVIEAMSRLPEQLFQLEVAGDGPQRAQLEEQARALGVPASFHGWLPRRPLCQLFDRSRIFVLASISDNFPVSLLEAMAAGCAIITTSAGGCPEVVGNAGLVVEPGDVGALQEALSRLIGNPARAQELGRRAALRARELFSWPAVAAHHEAAYAAVLRRQRSPEIVVAPV
jgi:glycosyltransferase involved in cell wall biosynthesis